MNPIEINCESGTITVDPDRKVVKVQSIRKQPVYINQDALARALSNVKHSKGLIASSESADVVDRDGHRIQVVVHHHPSDFNFSTWGNLRVDDSTSIHLNSWTFSRLCSCCL